MILGGNPVYSACGFELASSAGKAKTVIRLDFHEDESFPAKGWHLPLAHYLESWGDARTADGTVVPIQPLIGAIWRSLNWRSWRGSPGSKASRKEIVRETFRSLGCDAERGEDFSTTGISRQRCGPTSVDLDAEAS